MAVKNLELLLDGWEWSAILVLWLKYKAWEILWWLPPHESYGLILSRGKKHKESEIVYTVSFSYKCYILSVNMFILKLNLYSNVKSNEWKV